VFARRRLKRRTDVERRLGSRAAVCRYRGLAVVLLAIALAPSCVVRAPQRRDVSADPLYARFVSPSMADRPFVRWWWNGSRVDEPEITRELEIMRRAGVGGVEINTIGMPPAPSEQLQRFAVREWLSPAWLGAVAAAVREARARDMRVDLLVGSGWPFGGRFLARDEQIQRVRLTKLELEGPRSFEASLASLARTGDAARSGSASDAGELRTASVTPELAFLRLIPAERGRDSPFDAGLDLRDRVGGGQVLKFAVPRGKHVILAGFHEVGYADVAAGAEGADGPALDHFNAHAVRRYLERLSSALVSGACSLAAPGVRSGVRCAAGSLAGMVRAAFVDSLELAGANWTSDFAEQFARRRGYALLPYLPFVLDREPAWAEGPFVDSVRRVRHDYYQTLIELFDERFVGTLVAWAKDHGIAARMQAYGRETDPLHGSMRVDLPEGETWLWHDASTEHDIVVESTVINKYVASAGHLSGKRRLSFEAMTNTVPVFRETLADFKQALDATLLDGLNHPIVHGFNYSPREAGFPGWVQFGSYLNERTPFWPYFRRFSDYAARLGVVLRGSEAQAQVALLAPRADEWSRHGPLYQPFPELHMPWYQYALARAVHQAGSGADFVSERVLQQARFADGKLWIGKRGYELLILEDVESLEPATALALQRSIEAGGRIAVIGTRPSRSPGLAHAAERDASVQQAIAAAARAGNAGAARRFIEVAAPVQSEAGRLATSKRTRRVAEIELSPEQHRAEQEALLAWTRPLLEAAWVRPFVRMEPARASVSQVHHVTDDGRAVFFFANLDRRVAAEFSARFSGVKGRPWRWDPESGTREAFPRGAGTPPDAFQITLEPQATLLLVFEADALVGTAPARDPDPPPRLDPPGSRVELETVTTLDGPWQLELHPASGDPALTRSLPALIDLSTRRDDPQLAHFGGQAIYRKTFRLSEAQAALVLCLDLGEVHGLSDVSLNGRALGVRWWGRQQYDVRGALRVGDNVLTVAIATQLGNAMQHAGQRYASWFAPIPSGLCGPVSLAKLAPALRTPNGTLTR
jgi:hypothetical protein